MQQGGDAGQRDESAPRQDGWDGMRFHHNAWIGMKLKIYEWFISGTFHLTLWSMVDCRSLKPHKAKPEKGRLLYIEMKKRYNSMNKTRGNAGRMRCK